MTDNKFASRISPENTTPATSTVSAEVDAFLAKMRGLLGGRNIELVAGQYRDEDGEYANAATCG